VLYLIAVQCFSVDKDVRSTLMVSKKIGEWYAAGYKTRERGLCLGWVSLCGRKRRAKDDASRSREIEAERGKGNGRFDGFR